MVRGLLLAASLLIGLGSAVGEASQPADANYEDGALALKPRPYKRSPVASVVIKENATKALAGKDMPDDCTRFVVTPRQIRQYFQRAKPVSRRDFMHELDWSPCMAIGELKLADGRSGLWSVQQYGLGTLYIDRRSHYFHCEKCSLVNLVPELPIR
jgi:hypothetical protein